MRGSPASPVRMETSGSQPAHSRPLVRRILLLLLILVLVLAAGGFLYENISEARDRRFNPMQGQLVDVNGRKMHIDCTGTESPTVILDSGLGDGFLSWSKVQPEIAKFTRVCSYDRAGFGYSDPSSSGRTSQVIAEELHALLQAAGIAPPYVMVGHSMGGYNVRIYTNAYRKEIVAFPSHLQAWANLGVLLFLGDRGAELERLMDEMVERNPGPRAVRVAVETFAALGQAQRAAAWRARGTTAR